MDSFEKRLSDLPLARPSAELKARIFGSMIGGMKQVPLLTRVLHYGVSLRWAAVIAVVTGLAGATLMHSFDRAASPVMVPAEQTVTVQLDSDKNLFDFTRTRVESVYDDCDVAVTIDEEA
jgi:hypothetical protein